MILLSLGGLRLLVWWAWVETTAWVGTLALVIFSPSAWRL
jgi:hypothetical protein